MKPQFPIAIASATLLLLTACNKESTTSDTKSTTTNAASATPAPAAPASGAAAANNDVKTTASGIKYQVLKQGTGTVSPKATDTVTVHYHGTFMDGKVFDSSVQRGQPAEFPLNRVIAGWTEGVQLMKVGDKFRFEIPPNLAYGAAGNAGIPPNSTLVFEVELLGIK